MARTKMIFIRVSEEEKAEIERVAAEQRLTMSAFLRRCVILSQPTKPTKQAA